MKFVLYIPAVAKSFLLAEETKFSIFLNKLQHWLTLLRNLDKKSFETTLLEKGEHQLAASTWSQYFH